MGHSLGGQALQVRVATGETGHPFPSEANYVVEHQYLPVADAAGPDADRRHWHRLGDLSGEVFGDAFEHDGKAPGVCYGNGVLHEHLGARRGPGPAPGTHP